MTLAFSYIYGESLLSGSIEIAASDYDAAKAQLLSAKPDAKITAVRVTHEELQRARRMP